MTYSRAQLGQLFVIGYRGHKPEQAFLDFASEISLGGIILFADNCESPDALRGALAGFKHRLPELLIAIDQEGGRVCRLRGNPAELDAAADYAGSLGIDRFVADYTRAAEFMADLGINLNLAPVADLFLAEGNDCLRGRCYGRTPDGAIPFVRASIESARRGGLLSCIKHFPGLGAASLDPHKVTSEAEYDRKTWNRRERLTFAAGIEAGCDMVMTTHLLVPGLDHTVATGSAAVVEDMLRRDLGFDGPVITDELAMLGAQALGPIGNRTVAALNAGHDLLLFGQDWQQARDAFEAVERAEAEGFIDPKRIAEALARVAGVRSKLKRERSEC